MNMTLDKFIEDYGEFLIFSLVLNLVLLALAYFIPSLTAVILLIGLDIIIIYMLFNGVKDGQKTAKEI